MSITAKEMQEVFASFKDRLDKVTEPMVYIGSYHHYRRYLEVMPFTMEQLNDAKDKIVDGKSIIVTANVGMRKTDFILIDYNQLFNHTFE